jgi:hypothetical protein
MKTVKDTLWVTKHMETGHTTLDLHGEEVIKDLGVISFEEARKEAYELLWSGKYKDLRHIKGRVVQK